MIWLLAFICALALCIVAYMCWSNAAEEKLEMQRYEEAMLSTNIQDLKDYLVQFNDAPQEHRDSVSARLNLLTEEDADWANTIAKGARNALAEAGIQLVPGVSGNADEAVKNYLAGTLQYDPNTECHHHDHEHGEGHGEGHGCCHGKEE